MNIPSGVTVTLTGSTVARMKFSGSVTINGTLRSIGGTGPQGQYNNPVQGGTAGIGAGVGGRANTNTSSVVAGGNGGGIGGGVGGTLSGQGYYTYSYTYYRYGGAGGGGGSNLLTGTGEQGGKLVYWAYYRGKDGGVGGAGYTDPAGLTLANLTGGSGGGAGSSYYYLSGSTRIYGGGSGGGGGGGIGIETAGTFTMGSSGLIDVHGGTGGYAYTSLAGGGAGGSGGSVIVRANALSISTGATIDATGGKGQWSYTYTYYFYGNKGGDGGMGAIRIEAPTTPSLYNQGGLLGISTTTGSLTTGTFSSGGDTGTTTWQTAGGLAPDFTNLALTVTSGDATAFLEGAMADPVTGLRSDIFTGSQDVGTTPLTTDGGGSPDAIDGYKFFRLVFKLTKPTASNPDIPKLDEAELDYDWK
jgi:hypothetical protein